MFINIRNDEVIATQQAMLKIKKAGIIYLLTKSVTTVRNC